MGAVTRTFKAEEKLLQQQLEIFDNAGLAMGEAAFAIGELLFRIKDGLPHGEWLPYLETHWDRGERMAQIFMGFAKQEGKIECVTPKLLTAHWRTYLHPERQKRNQVALLEFGPKTANQLTKLLERVQKHASDLKIDLKAFQELITAAVALLDGRTMAAPTLLYGEFVKMTQAQYDSLGEKLGVKVRDELIEDLNNYIGSKGKRYKSHYHTLLQWAKKNGGQKSAVRKALENWDAKE
jgi:hypothetical protein